MPMPNVQCLNIHITQSCTVCTCIYNSTNYCGKHSTQLDSH